MRTILLFLVLTLSLPRWGQAQLAVVWNHSYGTALNERTGYTVAMPACGYLLVGEMSYPGLPPASSNRYLYFVRTNSVGDTLWTKRMAPPRSIQPAPTGLFLDPMIVDPTGNIVVTGFELRATTNMLRGFMLKLTPPSSSARACTPTTCTSSASAVKTAR